MPLKSRLRVFLDSNVIVSGLFNSAGAPGIILSKASSGEFQTVISQQILDEVVKTIRRKSPVIIPALSRLLVNISPEIIKKPTREELAQWAPVINIQDAGILAAAFAVQVDFLVTGDKHFFESPDIERKTGLRIITPAQFIKALEEK